MAAKKPSIDSPVPDYNGGKAPGSAMGMPIKTYPQSQPPKGGGKCTIDSPAPKKYT